MNKKGLYAVAAACLLVAGALGGSLLSASAATKGTSKSAPSARSGQGFVSNENGTHEKAESAAREAAEDSGRVPFGPDGAGRGPGDGNFVPNEDSAHEKAESAQREAQESQWKSQGGSPATPDSSSSGSSGSSTQ